MTLRLLDTDSHVAEPADLWDGDYMEPNYRGASPFRFIDHVDAAGRPGTTLYEGGGILMENAGYTAAAGVPREKLAAGVRYADSNHGGWDVSKRLADMDLENISHQVINPSS